MESYSLQLAGVLLTFLLKVAAAFVLCLCLTQVLRNPRHRFLTWLVFLLGSGVSWIALVADEVVSLFSRTATTKLTEALTRASGEHVAVPASWSIWIGRGAVLLTAAYIAGAMTLVGVHIFKHFRLRAWLKHARRPSPGLEQAFELLCRDLNIRRCRVLILPRVGSPATVYWWSPRILLPEVCEKLVGSPQLDNILRHELIHTLRCDYLWATLGDLLCALLFFHPAVWQARKKLMMQRELACDLGVIETHPEERADYADSLAAFVRLVRSQQRAALGVDFAGSPSLLTTRIHNILAEPTEVPRWKELACDAAFILFIVAFGAVSPALSVSLDFSSQSASAASRPKPKSTLSPLLPSQRPGLHRRHNRMSLEYVNTPGTPPLEERVTEGYSTRSSVTNQQFDDNAVISGNGEPADVDGPAMLVPFRSAAEMPIPDLLPGSGGYPRSPAREDK